MSIRLRSDVARRQTPVSSIRRCAVLALILVAACSTTGREVAGPPPAPADTTLGPLQREMRGLWVATVANIDWPSRAGLTADQQRAELTDILDRAAAAGMNTIVLQVRPAADAVYASDLEPWAQLLSGQQGSAPDYDPLAFAIDEAHARGLELHAWINPFRAGNTSEASSMAASHISRTRPDLVRVYGTLLWLDPGEPDAQEHSMRVIRDIVMRYDIDGIHADDYFYPYPQNDASGRPIVFPDAGSFGLHGGGLPLDDWRRANIDRFVERMYREVRAIRPTLSVGLSPFGIWRPGYPPGVAGFDAFAGIYADALRWLQQGWLDYMAPQLYWAIDAPQQSFPALLDWWLAQNNAGRHVWPGLAAYKVNSGAAGAFALREIPDQIRATRTRAGGTGHPIFNMKSTLKQDGGALATALAADVYRHGAVPPATPWLDATVPAAPLLSASGSTLRIEAPAGAAPRWWVVRSRHADGWRTRRLFGSVSTIGLDGVDRVLVHAASKTMILSPAAEWRRP
ncbi:glycoside hydrolase family 10 protein [soil metagenome]